MRTAPELLSSCGKPLPHIQLSIREADGSPVPAGAVGEICVKADVAMRGYRNLPEQTASTLRDGWLYTGDLGRMDERGYVYILDRKNFLIISGGFNVYPVVVENVLSQHPSVREVSVVGAPHPKWGEAVVAVVSLRKGRATTAGELIAFCRSKLAKWEVPKAVRIIHELPKGATGAIMHGSRSPQ